MTGKFSDEKLFSLCKVFGARALEARRKFLGLLPEVNRREAAEKLKGRSWLARRGFSSIFEFAKKLAGVSEGQVRVVLNIESRFEDKPILQSMLINGEVSVNKLARVVSIATAENQEALAEQVKILPNRAIEVLVRDVKNEQINSYKSGGQDSLQMPVIAPQGLHVQTSGAEKVVTTGDLLSMKMNLKLDDEIIAELHELQEKGIYINDILREALGRRRDEIAQEKEELAEARESVAVRGRMFERDASNDIDGGRPVPEKTFSRYISVRVKNVLAREYGTKCAVPACRNDALVIHHTARFALTGAHDPHFLAPLCKDHHLIAHGVDGKFWRERGR